MKQFPPLPVIDDDAAPTLEGHLWLLEVVEGTPLRFQLQQSGAIRFGGAHGTWADDAIPRPCRRAVRHVRERLDRRALRRAVDDVTALTFLGRATHRERIDYDWERLPPFLGADVWSSDADAFRPPSASEAIYDRLGLDPYNPIAQEVNSRDFDPTAYDRPASAWYDGPVAGVEVRDKHGNRGLLEHSESSVQSSGVVDATDAESLAAAVATDQRFERVAARLRDRGRQPTVDELQERVLEDVYREDHGRLFDREQPIDESAFRAAVATHAQRFLRE